MVPMNLLPSGGSADYIVTGVWAEKAVKEAKRVGTVKIAGSTAAEKFTRVPRPDELTLDPNAAYVHITTNNTIYGTQWREIPDTGTVPLVADTSSDMYSRPIDVSKYGLIYAGAQKNLAPAGLTLVIVREDLLARTPATLPTMLQYPVHVENKSMYNTPPVFAIYVMRLVLGWLLEQGGLEAIEQVNERKARKIYAEIDRTGFYRGHADAGQPFPDEHHLPAAQRGARKEVREGGDRGRSGRPEGAPVGRRDAGVDLQRVPRAGRRRARAIHAGIRAKERLRPGGR